MAETKAPLTVVICDDDEKGRRERWGEQISELLNPHYDPNIVALEQGTFEAEYNGLLNRRVEAREARQYSDEEEDKVVLGELPSSDPWNESVFDRADVLLVDYDLFQFRDHEYLTGAVLAYLVRCYSSCRAIVGVNERGSDPFDLTLADAPESFTDLIIGEQQIANPGLWLGQERGEARFRPWYWPALVELATDHVSATEQCRAGLLENVLDVTELEAAYEWMPRSTLGWLEKAGDEAQQAERTTLLGLARGPRLGLRRGDAGASADAMARIAAARIRKWVSRVVLPIEDVLIDAPHLAARLPGLLASQPRDLQAANASASIPSASAADCGLVEQLEQYVYPHRHWLPSAAFSWFALSRDRALPGAANPLEFDPLPGVFCEDVSTFLPEEHARRFVSRLDSSSPARWVADPETAGIDALHDVDYQPLSRLAL